MEIKQLDIKNRTYYFLDVLIWLNEFNPNLLKLSKKVIERYEYLLNWLCY